MVGEFDFDTILQGALPLKLYVSISDNGRLKMGLMAFSTGKRIIFALGRANGDQKQ